ncbi:hypothetical protein JCM11641_000897 [Rhodosporidiobolus odoratus]
MAVSAAEAARHPFSARAKLWYPPDFSKEDRQPKSPTSSTRIHLSFPPDEEKGRSLRTFSQSKSTGGLFGSAQGFKRAQTAPAGGGLLPSLLNDDGQDGDNEGDDCMLDEWIAQGGAKGESALKDKVPEESQPAEKQKEDAAVAWKSTPQKATTQRMWNVRSPPPRQPGMEWSAVLDHAVMKANGMIDLSGCKLTHVPHSIHELETLRAISRSSSTFERTQTLPASPTSPARSPGRRVMGRTASGPFGSPRSAAQTAVPLRIMLSNNELTAGSISKALWDLPNMISLSLRNNRLDYLPEGVGRLSGLKELNVAQNKLQYLPAEILNLPNLSQLYLYPNPFLRPPAPPASSDLPTSSALHPLNKRILGPLVTHFPVPTLVETCIRRLLSPLSTSDRDPAPLISHYDRSYLKDIPEPFLEAFVAILNPPNALSASTASSLPTPPVSPFLRTRHASSTNPLSSTSYQPFDPSSNICRSPAHPGDDRVFYAHAVERMEWVSERALQPAAGEQDKKSGERCIPILWRGCGARCLYWLEEEVEEEGEEELESPEEEKEVVGPRTQ